MARLAALVAVVCICLGQSRVQGQEAQDARRISEKIELLESKLELLKKENELLKRENELLKKEIALLSKEDAGKDGDKTPADQAKAGNPKTSVDGIEYEVTSSKINGTRWELTLSATSLEGDKRLGFHRLRAITDDGTTYEVKTGQTPRGQTKQVVLMNRPVDLPEGIKVQIRLNVGELPGRFTKFARIEIRQSLLGDFQQAVILKNVTIDR